MKILIANSNPAYFDLENKCKSNWDATIINSKGDLTVERLEAYKPELIFFPHWSFMIEEGIWTKYECVVFHMTDLPFGRGGSPLQNLIVKGFAQTVISAIRVDGGLDSGPVYHKEELPLYGTATEIFLRSAKIIYKIIEHIVEKRPVPKPQSGKVVTFKRRKPEDGDIKNLKTLEDIYDYIRMLDAEAYPAAFIETEHFRFEFKRASLKPDSIIADVRILKK